MIDYSRTEQSYDYGFVVRFVLHICSRVRPSSNQLFDTHRALKRVEDLALILRNFLCEKEVRDAIRIQPNFRKPLLKHKELSNTVQEEQCMLERPVVHKDENFISE